MVLTINGIVLAVLENPSLINEVTAYINRFSVLAVSVGAGLPSHGFSG
jgi:hypothetical protein